MPASKSASARAGTRRSGVSRTCMKLPIMKEKNVATDSSAVASAPPARRHRRSVPVPNFRQGKSCSGPLAPQKSQLGHRYRGWPVTTIHLPNRRSVIPMIGDLVVALEAGGYDGVWFGEVNNLDAVVPATLAAAASERVEVGLLLNTYTRAPATLAMTAATLADVAPGRANVVLGVASPLLVERWNGIPYTR